MSGLLVAMRQQLKLAKEASTALVEMGQAINANATREETTILLQGTLLQEAHVYGSPNENFLGKPYRPLLNV